MSSGETRARSRGTGRRLVKLRSIKRGIKPYVPRKALSVAGSVHGAYVKALFWYVDLRDRRHVRKTGFTRLPPASLRYRVHGSSDMDGFLKVGKRCSEDIQAALEKIGKNLDSFRDILDFGCGCGRTLLWFEDRSRSSNLYGTDIDAEAISWCRDNLDFAAFGVNDPLPPLRQPSGKFDLVYAISVFTHLNEEYQFRWLEELRRVTKPGGIVLLTVHGRHARKGLAREDVIDIEKKGFKFIFSSTMKGIFPEWYQNAYHTRRYVRRRYSKYFDVLDYIPRGVGGRQDMVVLRRP